MAQFHDLEDRVSEFFSPLPSENLNTVKKEHKEYGEG